MRLTIARADLARILSGTIKAVEARNTIPILSTVKLTAEAGKLTANATDLDIEIKSSIAADVETDGDTCVNAALLNGIVGKLPASGEVLLETKDNSLAISCGRSRFKLQALPAGDFPAMAEVQYSASFEIDLAALVLPLAFAMSTETTRYYLCGVYMHTDAGRIKAVATDGHRFALNAIDSAEDFKGIIIPAKTIGLLPRETVQFSVSDSKIRIVAGDTEITSKLIDGTYPDYERVIPKSNDKLIIVDNAAMRAASDRVALVSAEKARAVKINAVAGRVTLSVSGQEGNATEEIDAEYAGEELTVGLNSQYLANVAGMFPPGALKIFVADAGSPILFKADLVPDMLGIVMPVRIT